MKALDVRDVVYTAMQKKYCSSRSEMYGEHLGIERCDNFLENTAVCHSPCSPFGFWLRIFQLTVRDIPAA
jgi:hypothetical protein